MGWKGGGEVGGLGKKPSLGGDYKAIQRLLTRPLQSTDTVCRALHFASVLHNVETPSAPALLY